MSHFIIYALIDPRTHRVRYIGRSDHGLSRPHAHRHGTHSKALEAWIADLAYCRVDYTVVVLAEVETHADLVTVEKMWIETGFRLGWPIVNLNGVPDLSREVENPAQPLSELAALKTTTDRKWDAKAWRKDPTVKARLALARAKTKRSS